MSDKKVEYKRALEGLVYGHMTIDQAHILATTVPDEATSMLMAQIDLVPKAGTVDPRGWPLKAMEVLWRIHGPEKCVGTFFSRINKSLLTRFYKEKLEGDPGMFSDDSLSQIRLLGLLDLKPILVRLQAERLIPHANTLLGMPAQLKNDVEEVKKGASLYSFPVELNELLDKVEDDLRRPMDPFDQAATLKHLRTFYEKLHEHVGEELRKRKPETVDGTDLAKCGQALDFLCRKNLLTDKMLALGKGLYGVLSEEGVHAIKADREYVRLCRNMVAEYALVLFFELGRRVQ